MEVITIFFCSGGLSLAEDFDLPKNVLQNMLELMEEGNLSKEEVIEHLINNGFLPVEVTELGKLPISVGKRVNSRPRFKPTEHNREEITSERFKVLTSTSRVPFDERRNKLEIKNNPDFDFERINPEDFGVGNSPKIRIKPFVQSERQEEPQKDVTIISTTESSPNTTTFLKVDPEEMEKIEAVMTMIKMFENDQISEDELIRMMAQMSDEIIGDDSPITEFSVFNDYDMPVKSSFFNMDRPVQSSQEKPPLDPVDTTKIMFPEENVDSVLDPFNSNNFNSVPSESPKPSIKPFTSFGTTFDKNHNNFKSISGENPPHPPTTVATADPGPPHSTLFYDDLSNQQIEIKLPNSFPDFNTFDLQHKEYLPEAQSHLSYLPPPQSPVVPLVSAVSEEPPRPQHYYYPEVHQEKHLIPAVSEEPTKPQHYYYPEVHEEEHYAKHHYEETYSTYPYSEHHHVPNSPPPPPPPVYHLDPNGHQIYHNVNDRPLHFDEMTHKEFAPELSGYNGPREPFGPPASILPQFTPEFRELPDPSPPAYVKSLPDYPAAPTAYGGYNTEGYTNYEQQPAYYNSYTPSHSPDSHHHQPHHYENQYDHQLPQQYLPTPEYIPSEVVHQPEPEYPSPLYLHHGPGGYDDVKNHQTPPPPPPTVKHEVIEVPIYTPKDTYYSELGQEYGLRKPRELIPDLPDHNTDKPFAYEDLPLPPITGHREIDRNIEDIHRAFRQGDALLVENKTS